jgi:two-component system, NtrC family, sensor kinase
VRLTWKLTGALLLGIMLSLAGFAYMESRRETEQWSHDMRRDAIEVGRALRAPVRQAFLEGDSRRALSMVRDANHAGNPMRVRWVALDGTSIDDDTRARLRADEVVAHETTGERPELVTYLAVPDVAGAIEIREPLEEREAYVDNGLWRTVAASLLMTLVCGGIAIILGTLLVGKRVNRLIAKARSVGQGDRSAPLPDMGADELGELATEMNAMCERLARAREQVAGDTQQRMHALEQLRATDRLATVGNLAAGVAHELGTPLGVVAGRAEMIELAEVDGADAKKCGRIIREQSERMTRIIRQLLDFARRGAPEKAPGDLAAMVRSSVATLQPIAHKRRVHVVVDAPMPVVTNVDASQLVQAITNLTINAIQASKATDVTIAVRRVRARAPAGVAGGDAEREWMRIQVRDAGPGMTPEVKARVFEPFFTTRQVGDGAGLGLPVTYGIVREHGGWIDVASEVGRGSVFSLYLPALEAVALALPQPAHLDGYVLGEGRPPLDDGQDAGGDSDGVVLFSRRDGRSRRSHAR